MMTSVPRHFQKGHFSKAALIVMALLFAPCSATNAETNPSAPPALVPLRIAELNVGVPSAIDDLAIEKGIFAKHGIDLQVIHFIKGGAEAMAGVASGQVDMGRYGTPILTGISFGLPIKIVGSPANKRMNFELVARKGIGSVKELRGKVVACGALGGGSHQSLLKILQANGLTENDVSIVATGGTDAAMILRSGKIDAVITTEPTRLKLEDENTGTLIAKGIDYYGIYQHSFVLATNTFIKNHPDTIRNYFIAEKESLEYAKSHLNELIDFAAKNVNLKKEIIRAYFEEQFGLWDLSFQVDIPGTYRAVEILKELKEIKTSVNLDEKTWFDFRFIN
jgi:NitT/TauT family transport system substrate-binding protein